MRFTVALFCLLVGTMSHAVQLTQNFADLEQTEKSIFLTQPSSRGAVLITHGLNLRPSKMNEFAKFFYDTGYDVYRLTLSGHDGDMSAFQSATAEMWMNEVIDAEHAIRMHLVETAAPRASARPVLLLGFSLGGIASLAAFDRGLATFDKMILLAPPLQVTRTAALVKNLFGFPNMLLPSKNHPDYRVFSKTPVAAYKSLFDLIEVVKAEPSQAFKDSNAIAFLSPLDELVDSAATSQIIKNRFPNWRVNAIEKQNATLKPVSNHLMIDEASLGETSFRSLLETISAFIAPQ